MPLTEFQSGIGKLLAANRTEDSYLAGGAAILQAPHTRRFSHDLDFFNDSESRVAAAFGADEATLVEAGYHVSVEISQPGYIRVVVRRGTQSTKIEWAHDSAWRFMPVQRSPEFGFMLHPVDLATNKVLALAGRDEIRDLVDTVYLHQNILGLGPLVWAAVGKDPGFTPLSLLEQLQRRGKIQPAELKRLQWSESIDVVRFKEDWLAALQSAERFIHSRPPQEMGCLYFNTETKGFVDPNATGESASVPHFGTPGGVLPKIV